MEWSEEAKQRVLDSMMLDGVKFMMAVDDKTDEERATEYINTIWNSAVKWCGNIIKQEVPNGEY